MAKPSEKKQKPGTTTDKLYAWLNSPKITIALLFGILISLIFLYKPLVFEGKQVAGGDEVSGIGTVHQINQYYQETGKKALWNPYVFAGMPRYHRYGTVVKSLDTVLTSFDPVIAWQVIFLWLGAIGIFLLARWFGLSNITGIIGGIIFALMPHFQALIIVGHDSKLRAIMWIPWVLLTFLYFVKKRNILSALLFAFFFTMQFRTQHYQIIFYTLLLLLFTGIGTYVKLIVDKRWKEFGKSNALLIGIAILVFAMVAHPLLSIKEYTPYSTRGGEAINLNQQQNQRASKGVGFDYATNWSYSLGEFVDLFVPKFHGGTSQETYTGNKVPQLQNRNIPAYWGSMPFTQSYEYLGIILFALALVGIVFRWKQPHIKRLVILTGFALVLALGKHFAPLYKLFFYYVPYFDKFRSPSMILTLVMFTTSLFAMHGFDVLISTDYSRKDVQQKLYIIGGVIGIFLVGALVFASNFSFTAPGELQRYAGQYGQSQAQQIVNMLGQARQEIMVNSLLRSLLFLAVVAALIFIYAKRWINAGLVAIVILIFGALDVGLLSANYLKGKFANPTRIEQQAYAKNALDQVIQQDDSLFRVAPLEGNITQNTRWSYYYQSLGGYSAAKLQVIQDIFTNNLYAKSDPRLPFNLSILDMFNCKYIVTNQEVTHPQLTLLKAGQSQGLRLYRNDAALPRAFFVDHYKVIANGEDRLRLMNTQAFDPGIMALLEEQPSQQISQPDSSTARVTYYDPNNITYEIYTDKPGLMVMSEVYYPKGWKARLDSEQDLKIYKTDHVLRSVIVPAGQHTLELTFHPKAYFLGSTISRIAFILTYIGMLSLVIFPNRERILEYIRGVTSKDHS